jgi:hypothetical protein
MLSFKQFIKQHSDKQKKLHTHSKHGSKEEIPSIPSPIHFKYGFSEEIPSIPSPIHFKHGFNEDSENLNESDDKPSKLGDWFRENDNNHLSRSGDHDEISKNLQSQQTKDNDYDNIRIKNFTGSSTHVNKQLMKQSQGKKIPSEMQNHVKAIGKLIRKNAIKTKLHTYSGLSFDPEQHVDEKGRMKSPAFISTSHSKVVAHGFAARAKAVRDSSGKKILHIAEFHLKPGDSAMHIAHHSYHPYEHETVISNDVTLKHHGYREYRDGKRTVRVHKMSIHSED